VLPVHEIGVTARGTVPKTGSALHYLAEIGNGRTWATGESAEGRDQNGAKSSNVGLSLRPERWGGVEIGTSYYRDSIAASPSSNVDHRIAAVYAVYRKPAVEVMAEWLNLAHRTPEGILSRNNAGYAQVSKAWGKVRPYYRYDRLAVSATTPFIGDRGAYQANIVGLRLDPAVWIGLKAQYERTDEAGIRGINAVRTQLVFVF
jgi:hypothetical protein